MQYRHNSPVRSATVNLPATLTPDTDCRALSHFACVASSGAKNEEKFLPSLKMISRFAPGRILQPRRLTLHVGGIFSARQLESVQPLSTRKRSTRDPKRLPRFTSQPDIRMSAFEYRRGGGGSVSGSCAPGAAILPVGPVRTILWICKAADDSSTSAAVDGSGTTCDGVCKLSV